MKTKTTKSQIKSALRRLFLRSSERSSALKHDNYTCVRCGRKQSKAKGREVKVQVHHPDGINNWEEIYDAVYKELLCDYRLLETLCRECHKGEPVPKRNTGEAK